MRVLVIIFMFLSLSVSGQTTTNKDKKETVRVVDAACGQCQFGLEGNDCDLPLK